MGEIKGWLVCIVLLYNVDFAFNISKAHLLSIWTLYLYKPAEHPELYKDRSLPDDGTGSKQNETSTDAAAPGQRQAATDEFMLDRFRKRERHRGMRR